MTAEPFGKLCELSGEPESVAAAATYRGDVIQRLTVGIDLMGIEGSIWVQEMPDCLGRLTDASWWLAMKASFDRMDDTVLVQAIAFSSFYMLGIPTVVVAQLEPEKE